jgi:hypothetical protein
VWELIGVAFLAPRMLRWRPGFWKICAGYRGCCGPGSSVGIATGYGLDGPGTSGFGGLVVSMLATGIQDRWFAPDRSRRIFPAGKIHSMPSFGRGSKIICPMLVTRTTKGQKKVRKVNYGNKKNPGGPRFFAHVQTGPGAHPASCTMGTGSLPGVKRPGRGADHPPLLVPGSRKDTAIPLTTLWACSGL